MASRAGPVFAPRERRRVIPGEVVDPVARQRLARARLRRALAVAAVILAIGLVVAVYFSPLFRVQKVRVTGAATVPPEEIAALVDVKGESMIAVDFSEARAAIEANPAVKSVSFSKKWPQTVEVNVVERVPWGVWLIGETPYVIDDEGVVVAAAAPDGAPAIRATTSSGILAPGDRTDADAVALARRLVEEVPARLGLNLTAIEWSGEMGLSVMTDAGYRVVIGDSENLDYKLAVWAEIESEVGRESMAGRKLDLRFGDRPVLN